ncbi:hypothetical protein EYV94_24030 [Puteibacter caeruleilacunae]|nr:hypothetical protein EYV94_24030 [Puteibacter caeruleilacunae]
MNNKQIDRIMNAFLGFTALLIILGAIFRLQHYPHGVTLLYIGFIGHFIFSTIEYRRLKKTIKQLEEEDND